MTSQGHVRFPVSSQDVFHDLAKPEKSWAATALSLCVCVCVRETERERERERERETDRQTETGGEGKNISVSEIESLCTNGVCSGLCGRASSMLCPLGKKSEYVFGLYSGKRSCTCEEKLRQLPVPVALGLGAVGRARGTRGMQQDRGQRPVGKAEARVASWGEDSGQSRAPWPCA